MSAHDTIQASFDTFIRFYAGKHTSEAYQIVAKEMVPHFKGMTVTDPQAIGLILFIIEGSPDAFRLRLNVHFISDEEEVRYKDHMFMGIDQKTSRIYLQIYERADPKNWSIVDIEYIRSIEFLGDASE